MQEKEKFYQISNLNNSSYLHAVGYFVGTDESKLIKLIKLRQGIADGKGGIYGSELPIEDLLSGISSLQNLQNPVVLLLKGKIKKIMNVIGTTGWGLALSDNFFNYLDEIGLSELYEKIPIVIVNKNGEKILPEFKAILLPKKYIEPFPSESFSTGNWYKFQHGDDTRMFGGKVTVVNKEIKDKLKIKFPGEFRFYDIASDYTKWEE